MKPRVKTEITVKFGEIQFNLEEEQVKSCKNSTNKLSLGHLYPANYFVVYFKSLQNQSNSIIMIYQDPIRRIQIQCK